MGDGTAAAAFIARLGRRQAVGAHWAKPRARSTAVTDTMQTNSVRNKTNYWQILAHSLKSIF